MAEQFRLEQIRKEQEEEREVGCFTFSDNFLDSQRLWTLQLSFNTHCNFNSKYTSYVNINFFFNNFLPYLYKT